MLRPMEQGESIYSDADQRGVKVLTNEPGCFLIRAPLEYMAR